ncbi:TonB-dependent receptor plug domain-containing protein [Tsuneonella amylolytica]|uniref:TonB-dependent receptor plug domain-containing protein n=1 Tax=Tsuneonella amylolytica TaxID=2338327 RepID=UPI0013C4B705|nr:TonB-dependent receptor plug domain-containing protein [Tsuneonella amylolytica]
MSLQSKHVAPVVAALLASVSAPALSQDAPSGDAPPPDAPEPANVEGRQSYSAADFARFAPKTALDMLNNVPGFLIRGDQSGTRGLGNASENVLVNSRRLPSKSDDLRDQIARIPASSVVRIDIVDGATLSIPGLSGQVADIITRPDTFTGSFSWNGEARVHFTRPRYTAGEVSVKGTLGRIEYTAALANSVGGGGFGGPYQILNADRSLREIRDGKLVSEYDAPKLSVGLKHTAPNGAIANLNASYRRQYEDYTDDEVRTPVGGVPQFRDLSGRFRAYDYEFGGDYQFPVFGAQLKLIGLNRFDQSRFREEVVTTSSAGGIPDGGRYAQVVDSGEVIGRSELSWKWGVADWQIAGEAAFNRLDKNASLFDLASGGSFVEIPFPQGDGGVREDRYEASLSYGRPLTPKLSLQAIVGAEHSTISQTGPTGVSRSFLRPKGTLSLAWQPKRGLDLSFKLERAVGQLNFNDFLGRVFLDDANQNDSNFDLVPSQSWNVEVAGKKDLGPWGSTNLRVFYRDFEDYVDLVPLPGGGEGRGNIDRLRRYGFEWTSTVKLEPIGFRGAKIDSNVILQTSRLIDPLTGEKRQMDRLGYRVIEVTLRHDIPGSDWAWGAGFEHIDSTEYHRINEVGKETEGPIFDRYFIENKDVFGLTARLDVINLVDARHRLYRTVYTGRRDTSPVAFIEDQSRLIGPIFRLSLKGNF